MNNGIDQQLLHSFTVEAKSYLAEILNGAVDFHRNPAQVDRLEEAHRNVQTFRDAAAMVCLAPLSEVAIQLDEAFGKLVAGKITFSNHAVVVLSELAAQIDVYLGRAADGHLEEHSALTAARHALFDLCEAAEAADKAPPRGVNGEVMNRTSSSSQAASSLFANIPPELLDVFLPEAEEHLRTMGLALLSLAKQPDNKELLQSLRRSAHSLKGSAGMVGFQEIARLAHRMEDLLDLIYDDYLPLTPERLNLLFASTDALESLTDNEVDPQTLRSLYDAYAQLPELQPMDPEPVPPENLPYKTVEVHTDLVMTESVVSASSGIPSRASFVRVPITQLDELVKLVTELIITRTSFEQNLGNLQEQLEELRTSSSRLGRVASKMETQFEASSLGRGLRFAEPSLLNGASNVSSGGATTSHKVGEIARGFDELEFDRYTEFHVLLRGLSEATSDVETLDRELRATREGMEGCLNRQGKLSSEVQDKIMRLRMVPLATLSSRLARTIRTVATQRGKSVHFEIEGEETQLDKTVIEEMADPLLHFLRNAVDHGIESPGARRALGKPATGTIRLRGYYEGTQIILEISDDGAGIDPERLRTAAVRGGYLSESDAARIPVEDLLTLIFLPGFSTALQVSEISGRGVGLDVASVAIHRLKGGVKVDSKPGLGTTFTVRLPMTLAVMPALMVKTCRETFAIPLVGIKQILKVGPEQIERVGKDPVVRVGDTIFPIMSLAKLLNLKRPEERVNQQRPVLLMSLEERQVAVAVDETLAEREIVVKNLGSHLRQVHGVTGATLMGDGSVVLILNLAEMVRETFRPRPNAKPVPTAPKRTIVPSRRALTVMVIDDSVSVRRVLSNLLASAGWKPIQARDGLDALEMLPHLTAPPDAVLLDIEMPRMDGYEFISAVRGQNAYVRTPIIILTSRAGQKHRDKAFELGATDYMVKPYQDEALLALIRQLTQ